ncbi:MAG: ABC transporter permease [Muribaculaceae bacterium]|nr:ABC transporter permease [Roseburia sp.]MCM1432165.1 ABC transporter permease [Muribaculaceae bacterium]MCM1492149.1 ABC transporter permease [Muribaculaceae bacterium]
MNHSGKRKTISASLVLFELRNITGNPFVHIFGIGMPILMAIIIPNIFASEIQDSELLSTIITGVFLGIGPMIPLATILMGYTAIYSQELEKGIPQRMELFGIRQGMTILNRILSELIFQSFALGIYFLVGIFVIKIKAPTAAGLFFYLLCIVALSIISFLLGHAIALLFKKFGVAYCITMMIFFATMIISGMMGISYEQLPSPLQAVARLLPTTYITKDFSDVWLGQEYNFMPMLQAFLFVGALSGLLLFICLGKNRRRRAAS